MATSRSDVVRLAIVGCGDVLFRRYAPAIAAAQGVEVVACCDADQDRARRAAAVFPPHADTIAIGNNLDELVGKSGASAVLNLTPATVHGPTNRIALRLGLHVYSEKPLAESLEEADELIRLAHEADRTLACAPAILVSPRFACLRRLIGSGRLQRPRFAVAQIANRGPAGWPAYNGDPAPYYQPGIGPLPDEGIYLLHAITGMLGAARRIHAAGQISEPTRQVRSALRRGEWIPVDTDDTLMLTLELEGGGLAQVLSSFAVHATRQPTIELHGPDATISLSNHLDANGPIEVFVADPAAADARALEGWFSIPGGDGEEPNIDTVGWGAVHFVRAIRGEEPLVLTAEHARHTMAVMAAANASLQTGCAELVSDTWKQSRPSAG